MTVQAPESLLAASGAPASVNVAAPPEASRVARIRRTLEWSVPLFFLLVLTGACFLWPLIHHIPSPVGGNLTTPLLPPLSHGALFGTDQVGNDVFSRILYGGRVSLEVGLGTTAIGLVVGGLLGMTALKGGILEAVVMRVLEVFLGFPSLVLAIVVATYLGPSELHVIWAISFFTIPAFARLARAQTLRLRSQTFIIASRLTGSPDRRILLRHLVPNVAPQLLTFGLLGVGVAIMVEASLSFLGLGVPPPNPSWGNMIASGQTSLTSDPYLVLIPVAFLFATVLCLNLLGDAFRSRQGS
jgi:peptide/nickel transport system permease protein